MTGKIPLEGGMLTWLLCEKNNKFVYHVRYQSGMPVMTENIPSEDLDMVHFIIGHGILRKDLRCILFLLSLSKRFPINPRM